MAKINTDKGIYYFKPQTLFVGQKRIDKTIAKQNLLEFKRIAKNNNLDFGLIYGTLLGAIREHDFIEHDEDIDLFILGEEKEKLLNMLFELKDNGFGVIRYDNRGLLSIIRDNEYIDLYIFNKFQKGVRICCGECVVEKYILDTVQYEFLSATFTIPRASVEYLDFQYGSDWNIPIHYTDFNVSKISIAIKKIKERFKYFLPNFLFSIIVNKKERQIIKRFYENIKLKNIEL